MLTSEQIERFITAVNNTKFVEIYELAEQYSIPKERVDAIYDDINRAMSEYVHAKADIARDALRMLEDMQKAQPE